MMYANIVNKIKNKSSNVLYVIKKELNMSNGKTVSHCKNTKKI